MPNHYLSQCWVNVNWTSRDKLMWKFNQNIKLFIHKNASEYIVKWWPFCPGGDDLIHVYVEHWLQSMLGVNSLRPRQNGRLFADDTYKRIFLNEYIRISTKKTLKFVPKGLINNIPALVLIMAWRRPGDKPLSEPMMVSLPTHICVTRPQWVNSGRNDFGISRVSCIVVCILFHGTSNN